MEPGELWRFFPVGYLFTIAIETTVLFAGLARPHPAHRRLFAGVWLTACTYPIVVLVMPLLIRNYNLYLLVAEIFAPLAECAIFAIAFHRDPALTRGQKCRDFAAITLANLASFLLGLWVQRQMGS